MHTSDAERVREVVDILLLWIAACPDLVIGDPVELRTRGGNGSRIVIEVIPAPGPQRLRTERVDEQPRPVGR
ncbi:hypothetical protein [Streptosporangium sp. G12]